MKNRTLTQAEKDVIFERRGCVSGADGRRHPKRLLEIHHKDRNPENNDPRNLRILTIPQHQSLHRRAGY